MSDEKKIPENGLSTVVQPTPLALPTHVSYLSADRFAQALQVATQIAKTEIVPKQFRDQPAAIVVAWEMGGEIGLSPMASLQNIAVINGRPSLWGDSLPAVCMRHPQWGGMIEVLDEKTMTATCTVHRRDAPAPIERKFSLDDAKVAGLAGKEGPWRNYPKRMLQMRARAFALRDAFPDALRGMHVAEEVIDAAGPLEVVNVTPVRRLPPDALFDDVVPFIASASSEAELAPVIMWVEGKTDEIKAAAKKAYVAKCNELRKPPEGKASFGHGHGKQAEKPAAAKEEAAPPPHDARTGEVLDPKPAPTTTTPEQAGAGF